MKLLDMKNCVATLFFFLFIFLYSSRSAAQGTNPCGLVASMTPQTHDSVIAVNSLVYFTCTNTDVTSYTWLIEGTFSGVSNGDLNMSVHTGVNTISLAVTNGTCFDTTTVVYFCPGTPHNIDSFYLGNYGSFAFNEEGTCIDRTLDSGYVLGGTQYLYGNECGEAGIVVKLKDKGCIDWSKKFSTSTYCNATPVSNIYSSSDSNYYVVTSGIDLVKLNKHGDLIWNKRFTAVGLGFIPITHLTGDDDGALFIFSGAYNNGISITKLDPDGNVLWNKIFRLSYAEITGPDAHEFASPSGAKYVDGKLFVAGNAYSETTDTYFGFLARINPMNGEMEWKYGYNDPEYPGSMAFSNLTTYDTLLLTTGGEAGQSVTIISREGKIVKHIKTQFNVHFSPKVSKVMSDNKGRIYTMQWMNEVLPLQPYYYYYNTFATFDTALNKYSGMVYNDYSRGNFTDVAMSLKNKFAAIGNDFGKVDNGSWASRDFKLVRYDTIRPDAQFCYSEGTDFTLEAKNLNRINFQFLIDSAFAIVPAAALSYTVKDTYAQARYTCPDFIDSCSVLRLSGPKNICSLSDTYVYRLHRNKKCTITPVLKLPNNVTLVSQTDSTISVKFSSFGQHKIYATINSCVPVIDSLLINVVSKSQPLNLGVDTTICQGDTLQLHAGHDFFSYLWSNGSSDSLIKITVPGTYWIQTIDSCNNLQRDTITILPFNSFVNIGPDRISCANDTLHLNAPSGFINYQWSNNYNINFTNAQNVIIFPAVDTAYYLKAEKKPGCFAYDTVKIRVNIAPPIFLGNDKNFCAGDSALLDAGVGFIKYLWSNGASSQSLRIYSVGTYSVIATTSEGCRAFDTLRITNVWPKPILALDKNPNLCQNEIRNLYPGIFKDYLWQNGSKASIFKAVDTGTFFVRVTDEHLCVNSDTIRITGILPSPVDFLPRDTSICSYSEIRLEAKKVFDSYIWSNGTLGPSIRIKLPGKYSLTVIDKNKCKGVDSISVIAKQCIEGFFMPTAFSPNNDGINDVIKPLIFGNIENYEFAVYNRYGELIFSTNKLSVGWNGIVKGIKQNTGGYSWVCRFRLAGEAILVKKGVVMLLN